MRIKYKIILTTKNTKGTKVFLTRIKGINTDFLFAAEATERHREHRVARGGNRPRSLGDCLLVKLVCRCSECIRALVKPTCPTVTIVPGGNSCASLAAVGRIVVICFRGIEDFSSRRREGPRRFFIKERVNHERH